MNAQGKIAMIILKLAFVVRQRIQSEPARLFLIQCFELLDRQRIGKPERHEVYHRFLTPMRKLAPVDVQFYIWIEEIRKVGTYYFNVV